MFHKKKRWLVRLATRTTARELVLATTMAPKRQHLCGLPISSQNWKRAHPRGPRFKRINHFYSLIGSILKEYRLLLPQVQCHDHGYRQSGATASVRHQQVDLPLPLRHQWECQCGVKGGKSLRISIKLIATPPKGFRCSDRSTKHTLRRTAVLWTWKSSHTEGEYFMIPLTRDSKRDKSNRWWKKTGGVVASVGVPEEAWPGRDHERTFQGNDNVLRDVSNFL